MGCPIVVGGSTFGRNNSRVEDYFCHFFVLPQLDTKEGIHTLIQWMFIEDILFQAQMISWGNG